MLEQDLTMGNHSVIYFVKNSEMSGLPPHSIRLLLKSSLSLTDEATHDRGQHNRLLTRTFSFFY
jgi:hypothetical protein